MDYGIDASLEVLWNSQATNFRSQIQLKSTASPQVMNDGTFTLQVNVANLNYLLNGTSALYILYLADTKSFRFSWASVERKRLDTENPKWMKQESVTLHFSDVLDDSSLARVQDTIIAEARFRRQISDVLARHSLEESAAVTIDLNKLDVSDSVNAERTLRTSGYKMVTNGDWQKVLDLYAVLNSQQTADPKIRIVYSYALYAISKYYNAYSEVSLALLMRDKLDQDEIDAAEDIQDVCAVQLGRIDRDTALERQRARLEKSGGVAASLRAIDVKRFEFLNILDLDKSKVALDELNLLVTALLEDTNCEEAFKLQARTHLLYCQGAFLNHELTNALGSLVIRRKLETPTKVLEQSISSIFMAMADWASRAQNLVANALGSGHLLLAAEAMRTFVFNEAALMHTAKFGAMQTGQQFSFPKNIVETLTKYAEDAIGLFNQAGNVHGELETKMLLAEVNEMLGTIESAHRLAGEIVPIADALGMQQVVSRARDLLKGDSHWARFDQEIKRSASVDDDVDYANWSDVKIEEYARAMASHMDLPESRLPNVLEDVTNLRAAAIVRIQWCRHVQLLQHLAHTRSWITKYARPCDYLARCEFYQFEVRAWDGKAQSAIEMLKSQYCSGCHQRIPKS